MLKTSILQQGKSGSKVLALVSWMLPNLLRLKVIDFASSMMLLIVDAAIAESLLYNELEEIYGQNHTLNPPFIHVLGGINSNQDSDKLVASEEESEVSPSLSPI